MNIYIVDDHGIVRDGLKSLLVNDLKMEVAGEASDGLEALAGIESLRPDLVLMDIEIPGLNGIQCVSLIKERIPEQKIIMLSMHGDKHYIRKSFKAGAQAYVLKGGMFDELKEAIKAVKQNGYFISSSLVSSTIEDYAHSFSSTKKHNYDKLTVREKEIFIFTLSKHSRSKIADEMGISLKTLDQHIQNIKRKLEISDWDQAFEVAKKLDLI